MREDHRRQTDLFAVEHDWLIFDDALFAHSLDATPAGRLGQADALPDRRSVDSRLGLQQAEDFAIDVINGNGLHNLCSILE